MKVDRKDAMLDLIYPPRCPVCGKKLQGRSASLVLPPAIPDLICRSCFLQLPFVQEAHCMRCGRPLESERTLYCSGCRGQTHAFREARAVFIYKGAAQKSLYQLKYAGRAEYARFYAAAMAHYLGPWIRSRNISVIVPVPLHRLRQRERGYNQAAEIAIRMGNYLQLPVKKDLLLRVKRTTPQKMLGRETRRENLRDAFAPKQSIPSGESILLVDDIFTTGATADAASAVLLQAGCRDFFVAAAAITG